MPPGAQGAQALSFLLPAEEIEAIADLAKSPSAIAAKPANVTDALGSPTGGAAPPLLADSGPPAVGQVGGPPVSHHFSRIRVLWAPVLWGSWCFIAVEFSVARIY